MTPTMVAVPGTAGAIASYCEQMVRAEGPTWPEAGQQLLVELALSRQGCALIAAEPAAADVLVDRLAKDLTLGVVRVGAALAGRDRPPTAADVEVACGSATILSDIDLLLWPALGIPVLGFLTALARRRPIIAVWPGEITDQRARYSALGRPDYYERRLTDVVVLRPRVARFPDEVPYEIERIAQ
jgi:hypothetical protein